MNFDLKTAIGSFAPTLATMLGGPLAGTAVGALCGAFGLQPGASQDDVTKVVQGGLSPDTIAAIRAADQKHAEMISQHGIDLVKLNTDHELAMGKLLVDDKNGARDREVKTGDINTPRWLSLFAVLCFVALVIAVLMGVTPAEGMKDTFLILVGAAIAVFKDVYGYYFGSSSGSRENQEAMRKSLAQ